MIAKKKLRERLLDICNGAGMFWVVDDNLFEFYDDSCVCLGLAITAIVREFDIEDYILYPHVLHKFRDIDEVTEFIHSAICQKAEPAY